MSGFDTARLTVERLLAEAKDGDTLEKAANAALALTKASQAELDGRKVENEIIKLKNDVALGRRQARAESTRHYVSVFGPLATTFVLAGTLALQTYTAILSDQAKREELDRQRQDLQRLRDAEEDTRWAEMLKTLSQEYKELSPGLLNLRRFFSSPRYADQARVTAEQTLSQTANVDRFNDLFFVVFDRIDWTAYPKIMNLARSITARFVPLNTRRNQVTGRTPEDAARDRIEPAMPLTSDEKKALAALDV
jgi:ribosomal protein L17